MRTLIALVSCLSLSALVACSSERVCAPGSTQACLCAEGPRGVQSCASDGARWEPCACSAAGTAPANAGAKVADAVPQPQQPAVPNPGAVVQAPARAEEPVGPQPYTITIISADLVPSKPDGRPWDAGDGPPDPVVVVSVKGAGTGAVRTTKKQDSIAPTWRESGQVTINRGDHLSISIIDKDLADDDFIAGWDMEFTRPGRQRLTDPTHSVNELIFDIASADAK
ncbi:hypothetical protein [Polyangium fumosum]